MDSTHIAMKCLLSHGRRNVELTEYFIRQGDPKAFLWPRELTFKQHTEEHPWEAARKRPSPRWSSMLSTLFPMEQQKSGSTCINLTAMPSSFSWENISSSAMLSIVTGIRQRHRVPGTEWSCWNILAITKSSCFEWYWHHSYVSIAGKGRPLGERSLKRQMRRPSVP